MSIVYIRGDLDFGSGTLPVLGVGGGAQLHRLSRRPDAEWEVAPPPYRSGRVDPPTGMTDAFGMLYLADSVVTASFECGLLSYSKDSSGIQRFEINEDEADLTTGLMPPPLNSAAHNLKSSFYFVDIEHPSLKQRFGIDLKRPAVRIEDWRRLSLAVHNLVTAVKYQPFQIVGVTFETQQNGSNGRNFAIFECFKYLSLDRGPCAPLDLKLVRDEIEKR